MPTDIGRLMHSVVTWLRTSRLECKGAEKISKVLGALGTEVIPS